MLKYTLYIRNLAFVLAGREFEIDIVLSKNGVKCAVFKIYKHIKPHALSVLPHTKQKFIR